MSRGIHTLILPSMYMQMEVHLTGVAVLIRIFLLISKREAKVKEQQQKKSCSRWFVHSCSLFHPLAFCTTLTCNLEQTILHHPLRTQCSLLTRLQLLGKPSPSETSRDSTGWRRRDEWNGWRRGFGPVHSPGCIRPLALTKPIPFSHSHTHTHTHTTLIHLHTDRNTHAYTNQKKKIEQRKWRKLF